MNLPKGRKLTSQGRQASNSASPSPKNPHIATQSNVNPLTSPPVNQQTNSTFFASPPGLGSKSSPTYIDLVDCNNYSKSKNECAKHLECAWKNNKCINKKITSPKSSSPSFFEKHTKSFFNKTKSRSNSPSKKSSTTSALVEYSSNPPPPSSPSKKTITTSYTIIMRSILVIGILMAIVGSVLLILNKRYKAEAIFSTISCIFLISILPSIVMLFIVNKYNNTYINIASGLLVAINTVFLIITIILYETTY